MCNPCRVGLLDQLNQGWHRSAADPWLLNRTPSAYGKAVFDSMTNLERLPKPTRKAEKLAVQFGEVAAENGLKLGEAFFGFVPVKRLVL